MFSLLKHSSLFYFHLKCCIMVIQRLQEGVVYLTELRGRCKKKVSCSMPTFTDREDFVKEFSVEEGEDKSIYLSKDGENYEFKLHYQTIIMTRADIEEHFDIMWERDCYNTCIRDGVPCENLTCYHDGDMALDKRRSTSCRISWEIGRGACARYETVNVQ